MDMAFTSFDSRFSPARETAPDFAALVTLLAAHQAAQPTARIARRIDGRTGKASAWLESLVDLLVQRRGAAVSGGTLRGSFNPAVPNPNTSLTEKKAS